MVDGNAHPDLTVASGSVTLANSITGSTIQFGLGNTWAWQSQRIEGGSKDGVSQGKTKRITGLVIRLLNTLGVKYGPTATAFIDYDFEQGQTYDESLALFSGDTPFIRLDSGYDQEGIIYLQHDGVFPATILAVIPTVVTQDK